MRKRRGRKSEHPVKPDVGGIWYWWCDVCSKKYIKDDSHVCCYDRYCKLCDVSFKDEKTYVYHVDRYHLNECCDVCNQLFIDLASHQKYAHLDEKSERSMFI